MIDGIVRLVWWTDDEKGGGGVDGRISRAGVHTKLSGDISDGKASI